MEEFMPEQVMADYVRGVVEDHEEWDSIHEFMILGWDGEKILCDTLIGIDPAVEPSQFGSILPALAAKHMAENPDSPPYAYCLKVEAWAARGDDTRPPSERPDRVEVVLAICADIEGRLWAAQKQRDNGEIDEYFVEAGETETITMGGRFTDLILSIAEAAGRVQGH